MKIMRHLGITVLSLSLLGWVAACAGTNRRMDKKMSSDMSGQIGSKMGSKMDSMLYGSEGHHASGRVSFAMGTNNKEVLTLSDIKVDKVPDGYVYLTKNANRMHGVELGKLKQFSGTVSFDLPAGVNPDDYDSVVIWCKKFNVEIGRAYFPKKMM
jgi:hypothetical protein